MVAVSAAAPAFAAFPAGFGAFIGEEIGLAIVRARRTTLAAALDVFRFAARVPGRTVSLARIAAQIVVVVSRIASALVLLIVFRPNDVIEPFADGHAGFTRGAAGGFARFWTEASQVPRTARFHCAPKSHREERHGPILTLSSSFGSATDEAAGAASLDGDFSRLG
jgi:hypothetical protein